MGSGSLQVLLNIRANIGNTLTALRQVSTALGQLTQGIGLIATGRGSAGFSQLSASARTLASTLRTTFTIAQQSASTFSSALSGPQQSLVGFTAQLTVAAAGVRALAQAGLSMGQALVGANSMLEGAITSYQVLLREGSETTDDTLIKAQRRIQELQQINLESPFDLPQLLELDRQLTVVGARTSEFVQNIADAAAATRAPIQDLGFALSRVGSGDFGYAFMRLRELAVATQTDLEMEGLKFDKNNSYIGSADDALSALNRIFERRFGDAARLASQTFEGISSNIRDAFFSLRAVFGAPIFDALKDQMNALLVQMKSPEWLAAASFAGQAVGAGFRNAITGLQVFGQTLQRIGGAVYGFLDDITGGFSGFAAAAVLAFRPLGAAILSLLRGDLGRAASEIRTLLSNIVALIVQVLSGAGRQLFTGGLNAIAAFAEGMISGASRYVSAALNAITTMISDFLMGRSPPPKGPLSTIDTWFPSVLESYLGSWTQADFGALNEMTDYISERMQTLVEAGRLSAQSATDMVLGTDGQTGLNQLIAQVLDSIVQTGEVNTEAMAQIQQLLGQTNADIFQQLKARFAQQGLEREIALLQAAIKKNDNPGLRKALSAGIDAAEDALRNARSARDARAAREQIATLKSQEQSLDAQSEILQGQLDILEEQRQVVTDQIAGYEAVERLRQRELDLTERLLDIERQRLNGGGGSNDAAEAEWRYNYALANNVKRLEMLREKLAAVEAGTAEYFNLQTQIATLETQMAEEREQMERRRAEAEWDYNFALADNVKKLAMLRAKLGGVEEGSLDYYQIQTQIRTLELQMAKEREDQVKRRADAEWDYAYAIADNAGRLELLRSKLGGVEQGSEDYYKLQTQIHSLETTMATERERQAEKALDDAKKLADAQWDYAYALADEEGKLKLLEDRLGTVDAESEEGYRLRTQIAQARAAADERERKAAEDLADAQWDLEFATADMAKQLEMLRKRRDETSTSDAEYYELTEQIIALEQKQTDAATARADAEWEYTFALADRATQIQMLEDRLASTQANTDEWYRMQLQLRDLRQDEAEDIQRAADAQWEYEFATASLARQQEMLQERLGRSAEGSEEYYRLQLQLRDVQEKIAQEQQEVADAEWDLAYARADNVGKLALLQEKLAGTAQGSAEYYAIQEEILQLEQTMAREAEQAAEKAAREAEARRQAELDYRLGITDTAGQLAILQGELGRYQKGSAEWYAIMGQIHDLETRLADEARDAAEKAAREQEKIADAQLAYQMQIGTTADKLALMRGELAKVAVGSAEYYDILTKIDQLEDQLAREAEDGIGNRSADLFDENDTTVTGNVKTISELIDEGRLAWENWGKQVDDSAGRLDAMKDKAKVWLDQLKTALLGLDVPTLPEPQSGEARAEFQLNGPPEDQFIGLRGIMKDLWEDFDNLKKKIEEYEPVWTAFRGGVTETTITLVAMGRALKEFIDFVREYPTAQAALVGGLTFFGTLGGLLFTIAQGTRLWAAASAALTLAMSANPIVLVVAAIAGLAAGLVYAYKNSEAFRNAVNTMYSAVYNFVVLANQKLSEFVGMIDTVFAGAIAWGPKLYAAMVDTWYGLSEPIDRFVVNAGLAISGFLTAVDQWFINLWHAGVNTWHQLIEPVQRFTIQANQFLNDFFMGLALSFIDAVDDAEQWTSDTYHWVVDGLRNIFGRGNEILDDFFTGLAASFVDAVDDAKQWVKDMWQWITDGFWKIYDDLIGHSIVVDLVNGVIGWFERMVGAYTSGGGGVLGRIYHMVDWVVRGATEMVGAYGSGGGGFLGRVYELVDRASNAVTGFVGSYASGGNGVLGSIWTLQDNFFRGVDTLKTNVLAIWNAFFGVDASTAGGMWFIASLAINGIDELIRRIFGDGAADGLWGFIDSFAGSVRDLWNAFFGENGSMAGGLWYIATMAINGVDAVIRAIFGEGAADGLWGFINNFTTTIRGVFNAFFGPDATTAGGIWYIANLAITKVDELIRAIFGEDAAAGLWGFFKGIAAEVTNIFNALFGTEEGAEGGIWNRVSKAINGIDQIIRRIFGGSGGEGSTGLLDYLQRLLDPFQKAIEAPFRASIYGLQKILGGFGKVIKSGMSVAIDVVKSFAQRFVEAINMVSRWITGENAIEWSWNVGEIGDPPEPQLPEGYAKGTNFFRGGMGLVGEEGPELVKLPIGARIIPHRQTRQLLGWGENQPAPGAPPPGNDAPVADPNAPPFGVDPVEWFLGTVGAGVRKVYNRIKNGARGLFEEAFGLGDNQELSGSMQSWGGKILDVFKEASITRVGDMIRGWVKKIFPEFLWGAVMNGLGLRGNDARFAGDRRSPPPPEEEYPDYEPPAPPPIEGGAGLQGLLAALGLSGAVVSNGYTRQHGGLDFAGVRRGTPLLALFDGTIQTSRFHAAYGNQIEIRNSSGRVAYYGHLKDRDVEYGEPVRRGQRIGTLGNTGTALYPQPTPQNPDAGTHLHFELSNTSGVDQHPLDMWNEMVAAVGANGTVPAGFYSRTTPAVAQWVTQAVDIARNVINNVPNWLWGLSVIAMHESGGNPRAINNWDSNAAAGIQSRGLMQTIPATYNGNVGPYGRQFVNEANPGDIYTPVSNIMAAIFYILRRYRDVLRVPGVSAILRGGNYVGYAKGGIIREPVVGVGQKTGTNYLIGEAGPEMVIPMKDRLIVALAQIRSELNGGILERELGGVTTQVAETRARASQQLQVLAAVAQQGLGRGETVIHLTHAPQFTVSGVNYTLEQIQHMIEAYDAQSQAEFYRQATAHSEQWG